MPQRLRRRDQTDLKVCHQPQIAALDLRLTESHSSKNNRDSRYTEIGRNLWQSLGVTLGIRFDIESGIVTEKQGNNEYTGWH